MRASLLIIAVILIPNFLLAETQNFNSAATILSPISISETTTLSFGLIITNLSVDSAVSVLPDNTTLTSDPSTVVTGAAAGVYKITGSANTAVSLSLDNISQLVNGSTSLYNFSPNFENSSTASNTNLNSSGEASVKVQSSIIIAAGTTPGHYTGTFDLIANY